jgi:hypothetical protein
VLNQHTGLKNAAAGGNLGLAEPRYPDNLG